MPIRKIAPCGLICDICWGFQREKSDVPDVWKRADRFLLEAEKTGVVPIAAIFCLSIVLSAFTASRLTAITKGKKNNLPICKISTSSGMSYF
jgi:hypothetical protein